MKEYDAAESYKTRYTFLNYKKFHFNVTFNTAFLYVPFFKHKLTYKNKIKKQLLNINSFSEVNIVKTSFNRNYNKTLGLYIKKHNNTCSFVNFINKI